MRHSFVAALIWLAYTTFLLAQDPQPQFEVASVKQGSGFAGVRGACHGIDSVYSSTESVSAPPLGRCVITDGRLSHLIGIAYNVPMSSIKNAPDWVIGGTDRYTIQAKAEDPMVTEQQLIQMLQNLLADRFQLRFHRESKDLPGFALNIGRKGPKLQETTSEDAAISFGPKFKPVPGQPITLVARRYSMKMLADMLSQIGPGPMVDHTGLTGLYDLKLSWDEKEGPALSTALEEQLGLHLTSEKVPVSFFMFDSAQKPAEN